MCFVLSSSFAAAQSFPAAERSAAEQKSSFTLQAGFAPSSSPGFGVLAFDRHLFLTAIGYSTRIHQWRRLQLNYHADLVPVAVISDPGIHATAFAVNQNKQVFTVQETVRTARNQPRASGTTNVGGTDEPFETTPYRSTAFGAGANPVGLELQARTQRRIRPFLFGSAGVLLFTREEPYDRTSAFNFSYAFGAGADIQFAERKAFTLGYKILHISNADLGHYNPGINQNYLYVGYRFSR